MKTVDAKDMLVAPKTVAPTLTVRRGVSTWSSMLTPSRSGPPTTAANCAPSTKLFLHQPYTGAYPDFHLRMLPFERGDYSRCRVLDLIIIGVTARDFRRAPAVCTVL
jgi:hypothetical protein